MSSKIYLLLNRNHPGVNSNNPGWADQMEKLTESIVCVDNERISWQRPNYINDSGSFNVDSWYWHRSCFRELIAR